ncbi:hypothetical protein AZA_26926 [Nitrospirillum viridazoti Y2]|nr:hypothetical protein AZA_26926 [Nitrospirillum amazonense Y2]
MVAGPASAHAAVASKPAIPPRATPRATPVPKALFFNPNTPLSPIHRIVPEAAPAIAPVRH